MRDATIEYNGTTLLVNYEFTEGEQQTDDYPGSNPTVRIWSVWDKEENNITHTLTSKQWYEIENLCFENEID